MQSLSILNHDMEPYSLAALEALETGIPASPSKISGDESLAELESIRAGWIAQARAQQIPDTLFEIARWLGKDTDTLFRGIHRCLFLDGFRICAGVELEVAEPISNRFITHRRLTVLLDNNTPLVTWHWYYFCKDVADEPTGEIENAAASEYLYVPGAWVSAALAMTPKAEAARVGYARNAEAKERDELARKLLVGKEV
jgi:hypothetical protein